MQPKARRALLRPTHPTSSFLLRNIRRRNRERGSNKPSSFQHCQQWFSRSPRMLSKTKRLFGRPPSPTPSISSTRIVFSPPTSFPPSAPSSSISSPPRPHPLSRSSLRPKTTPARNVINDKEGKKEEEEEEEEDQIKLTDQSGTHSSPPRAAASRGLGRPSTAAPGPGPPRPAAWVSGGCAPTSSRAPARCFYRPHISSVLFSVGNKVPIFF